MAYSAEILADSVSSRGHRLTTMEVTFPRFVLAEFNTHRVFSRNSASSRAIPVEKQLSKVLDDPFIPVSWGVNQPGMQALEELNEIEKGAAEGEWLKQRDFAILGAVALIGGFEALQSEDLKDRIDTLQQLHNISLSPITRPVHKQVANRLLEPYMWHTAIVTATEWDNFYALRANEQAQPEIRVIAEMMKQKHLDSHPALLGSDQWHLPLIYEEDYELTRTKFSQKETIEILQKVAVGRCARVSYLTHDGKRDLEKDIELYDRLASSGHMSPMEHVARPMAPAEINQNLWSGNFKGWHQHRKDIPNEDNYAKVIQDAKS